MKIPLIILWLLSVTVAAAAQSATNVTESSGLAVVKYSWSKERVGWEQNPFSGPIENFDEMRVRARNEKRISDAKRGGNSSELSRAERDARTDQALVTSIHTASRARYGFVYKLRVENKGDKSIKAFDWDYVFVEKGTEVEVGRRQFTSVEKISPGKTKGMQFFIPNPPTKTISLTSLRENERDSLEGSVVIVRVEYSDGTFWQRP